MRSTTDTIPDAPTLRDVVPSARTISVQVPQQGVSLALPDDLVSALGAAVGTSRSAMAAWCLGAWLVVVDRLKGSPDIVYQPGPDAASALALRLPREQRWCDWIAGGVAAREAADAPLRNEAEFDWLADGSLTPAGSGRIAVGCSFHDGAARLWLHAGSGSIDDGYAQRLLEAWARVLAQVLAQPERVIGELDPVAPAERAQQVSWQGPSWPYDGPLSVVQCFADVVARHARLPALRWDGGEMDYAGLASAAGALAQRLHAAGVRPGHTVALALRRDPRAVPAMLAVLQCGAAYLPLDEAYPAERLAYMLADADVRLALVDDAPPAQLPPALSTLRIGPLHTNDAAAITPLPVPADARGARVAYLMYTSGSTGQPKGVEICERSIVRLVKSCNFMRLDPSVVMLQAAPLGFDASTLEIWGPLLNGGCCALHGEAVPTGPGLAEGIRRHGITSAWLTAALFNAVVDDDPRHLSGLRELLTGGEALSVPHVVRAQQQLPGLQLINGYGPTETTTFAATWPIPSGFDAASRSVPIGRPVSATRLDVVNRRGEDLPSGSVGELWIGGLGVARGYRSRPELSTEKFVPDPAGPAGALRYRSGDLVRWLPDGSLDYIGRADGQIKIRGYRIETGEIETALAGHAGIKACAVLGRRDPERGTELVAYWVPAGPSVNTAELREHLAARLPDFMVPTLWVPLPALPITPNGKLDRRALPAPRRERPDHLTQAYVAPRAGLEREVAELFARVLGIDRAGALDNFFDLGGNSLLIMKAFTALRSAGHGGLAVATLFADPTARGIARALAGDEAAARPARRAAPAATAAAEPIAIVGMAGRFPGAPDVESFWQLMDEGRDAIRFFKPEELDASIPASLRTDPQYVAARGVVDGVDLFDAGFFGITPREAELMDPQQRVFLELCWECLERAGQVPEKTADTIGVFAGMYNASYFQRHVLGHPEKVERLGEFQVMLANEKDYIATRTAHKLNLSGPAVSVHTACSTSLVAIAQAFDALRGGQCGLALAGGSSITCPPNSGYLYQEGSMLSPDGHTRSFDADAQGTVFSDGAAVVLLKRLSDAIADGNTIHAVIRGVAINNDGANKASFTAPSVQGQAAVVSTALEHAGVDARSISYVETHGTATPLGDPVEVAALQQAFRRHTSDVGFCTIGSLKSNTGHMVIAAGAAGVIKTAMALERERLPGTAHFRSPNPKIDFAGSPFVVHADATPWPRGDQPRRAGVSSFGVGGTNAHAVLEEAPVPAPTAPGAGPQLLRLSARSQPALAATIERLADHLERHPELDLADVAHTLDVGRRDFNQRSFVVAASAAEAVAALRSADGARARSRALPAAEPQPVLMFPGQGAQYAGMGRELHAHVPAFRAAFDDCLAALDGAVAFDLRALMFGDDPAPLAQTAVTQPATFCLEYAIARSWLAQGLQPAALIGHSVGEFVAAVLAGVMPLADAARLVAKRGALMQALPAGAMLSVRLGAIELEPLLPAGVQLAAENGPSACVVAGPADAIDGFAALLEQRGAVTRRLQTSHAFHSAMMDPALPEFEAAVRAVPLSRPTLRIVSTVTGTWLTDAQATDPAYWARHLRETVRFSPAVRTALAELPAPLFLEAGPRTTLATLVRQHRVNNAVPLAVASGADEPAREHSALVEAAGQLWTAGAGVPWPAWPPVGRRRVTLPSYPFERQRHWVEAVPRGLPMAPPTSVPTTPAVPAAAPVAALATLPAPVAAPIVPSLPPVEIAMTVTASPPADRRPALIQRLRGVFEDVSGIELDGADAATSFVELGLDSLTLTQAALQLKKEFALNITFRQLMESYRSFDTLAGYLDEKLPPEAAPAPVAVPAAAIAPQAAAAVAMPAAPAMAPAMAVAMPAFAPAAAGTPLMQQIIQQQMQLMAQQLALLQGQPVALQPVTLEAAPPAVAATPAVPAASAPAAAAPPAPTTPATPATPADEEAALVHKTYDVKKAFGAIARIHTAGTEMSERQRARLDAFMRRYIQKTQKSKAYTVEHRPHLADPRVVNGFRPQLKEIIYQIVIDRSKGSRLWDLDGNEYVDALNGFGMSLFGWQPDFVLDAVRKQLDGGYDIGPQHPLAGEVARLMCKLTGFDRAGLCNTGSEAVMGCVRIARTITGRSKIAIFAGAYHGIFDEVIVRGTKKLKSIPAAPGILPNTAENVVVLDYGTPETLQWLKDHADELAAVLVEPVQSRRPDFQPKEFLRELRTLTEKAGSLLIFDEVVTGFRSHPGGIQALFGIRADLGAYGKVVGGGFPIGVIAGKREFMDALDGGHWEFGDDSIPTVGVTYFAGTFVRHPLALVAAKAVLEHLDREGPELQATLTRSTAAMVDELNAFCREVGAPIVLKSFSSVWKVFFDEDHPLQDLLFAMMRNRGVHILDNFPCFMTTAHTAQDIAIIKTAFKEAVAELQQAEFLPSRKPAAGADFDASKPPVPGARLGKGPDGKPAWFVANPDAPGKFMKVVP